MSFKDLSSMVGNNLVGLVAGLNLILVVLGIANYANKMSSIIRTITLTFFDLTLYSLVAIIAVSMFVFFAVTRWRSNKDSERIRRGVILDVVIAIAGILSYEAIMWFIITVSVGEFDAHAFYLFPNILVDNGHGMYNFFDPTPWILLSLVVFNVYLLLHEFVGLKISVERK